MLVSHIKSDIQKETQCSRRELFINAQYIFHFKKTEISVKTEGSSVVYSKTLLNGIVYNKFSYKIKIQKYI